MAEAISGEEFLAWASSVGIGFDPRYPESDRLVLLAPQAASRFWEMPDHPYAIPGFVDKGLAGFDPVATGILWPRDGCWYTADTFDNEQVRDVIWRGAGVPLGWSGAVRVKRDERHAVVAVLFASLALGGDGCSDVFFVP